MHLWKTTILPTDSKTLSNQILGHLIHDEPFVLIVVIGSDAEAQKLAERASARAGDKDDPWWVVWARRPNHIEEEVRSLTGSNQLPSDLSTVRGFTISFADEIIEVFPRTDPIPHNLKIIGAFIKAARVNDE